MIGQWKNSVSHFGWSQLILKVDLKLTSSYLLGSEKKGMEEKRCGGRRCERKEAGTADTSLNKRKQYFEHQGWKCLGPALQVNNFTRGYRGHKMLLHTLPAAFKKQMHTHIHLHFFFYYSGIKNTCTSSPMERYTSFTHYETCKKVEALHTSWHPLLSCY